MFELSFELGDRHQGEPQVLSTTEANHVFQGMHVLLPNAEEGPLVPPTLQGWSKWSHLPPWHRSMQKCLGQRIPMACNGDLMFPDDPDASRCNILPNLVQRPKRPGYSTEPHWPVDPQAVALATSGSLACESPGNRRRHGKSRFCCLLGSQRHPRPFSPSSILFNFIQFLIHVQYIHVLCATKACSIISASHWWSVDTGSHRSAQPAQVPLQTDGSSLCPGRIQPKGSRPQSMTLTEPRSLSSAEQPNRWVEHRRTQCIVR